MPPLENIGSAPVEPDWGSGVATGERGKNIDPRAPREGREAPSGKNSKEVLKPFFYESLV